jgi:hypothetical protein
MTLLDLGGAGGSRIGRYFGLVSALPSAVLVMFTVLLYSSGAWDGPPKWQRAVQSFSHLGLGEAAVLSLVAVVVGLVLHPLQFALVQMYEGYWGGSRLAQHVAFARAMRYWRQLWSSRDNSEDVEDEIRKLGPQDVEADNWLHLKKVSMSQLDAVFPETAGAFMPTRLGNVLRRYELAAGAPFGLQAVYVIPQLALVAPDKDVAYLDDQRSALDLAVRMSATCLLATGAAIIFLCRDGLWLLAALFPYGLAYMFYRGAVVTAREYGAAMASLIALNRFALYERLGMSKPTSTSEERKQNVQLEAMYTFGKGTELASAPVTEPRWKRIVYTMWHRP